MSFREKKTIHRKDTSEQGVKQNQPRYSNLPYPLLPGLGSFLEDVHA